MGVKKLNKKRHLSNSENDIQKKKLKTEEENEKSVTTEEKGDSDDTQLENSMIQENGNEETHVSHDGEESETEVKITEKDQKLFNGKYLRSSLKSQNGLDALRKFVLISKENKDKDIVSEFLTSGGSILEVLRLLDSSDKRNVNNASVVFSAVNILIMKILSQYPQYQSNAQEACRHLINSHLPSIYTMIAAQSSPKNKKTVLRLLAAMVSLGGTLPREILTHLTLHSETIDHLTRQTKPTDPENVRVCFIHFILAFLFDENVTSLRILLDKRNLLLSIFPELIYDSKKIVSLVLGAVKSCILQNPSVSKTTKLHTFSTNVLQNLISLYNWKGPKNWAKFKGKRTTANFVSEDDKEAITDIVHDFLITLLTSHKHGIVFHDRSLGASNCKSNQLVYSILQSMNKPWEHSKPADLVIKILIACPDLIKSQYAAIQPYLEIRVSKKWIIAMQFLKKIIESINVQACLNSCSLESNSIQFVSTIMNLIVPLTLMKSAIIPALNHNSIIVRHQALCVLQTMLQQVDKFIELSKTHIQKHTEFIQLENYIMDHILKHMPHLSVILQIWNQTDTIVTDDLTIDASEELPDITKYQHYHEILNLLLLYKTVCPKLLHTVIDKHPNTLIDRLNELSENDSELVELKIKAIQFLLALDSSDFISEKKRFNEIATFLCELLNESSTDLMMKAHGALKLLIMSSRMFEGCENQVDIWIEYFCKITNDNCKIDVFTWFLSVIDSVSKNTEKYVNIISTRAKDSEQHISPEKMENIFDELSRDKIVARSYRRTKSYISISPLLCCALEKLKKKSSSTLLEFMSYVLVHTLHCQVTPGPLIYMSANIDGLPVNKYLLSWLNNELPCSIKKFSPLIENARTFNKIILAAEEITTIENSDSVEIKSNAHSLIINNHISASEVVGLFRMAVFYLTQFAQQGSLTEIRNHNCKTVIKSILKFIVNIDANVTNELCEHFFTHPTILYYFSPFYKKEENTVRMITFTFEEIFGIIFTANETQCSKNLIQPYKNKFIDQLRNIVDEDKIHEMADNTEKIMAFFNYLDITLGNTIQLLNQSIELKGNALISKDKTNLSLAGYLIPKLLSNLCMQKCRKNNALLSTLNDHSIMKIYKLLIHLKRYENLNLIQWEDSFNQYLLAFPWNIKKFDTENFKLLLSRKINSSTVNIIVTLINRNGVYLTPLIKFFLQSDDAMKQYNVIFSLLENSVNLDWDKNFLKKLFQQYKPFIINYLSNPGNEETQWITSNVNGVKHLIESTFDLDTCEEAFALISQAGDKLDFVHSSYAQILECLYKKYRKLEPDNEEIASMLILILLHITTQTLKKEAKNNEKILILCELIIHSVNQYKEEKKDAILETLSNSNSWRQYTRLSLKLGLKLSKNEVQLPVLKALNSLCKIAYKDGCEHDDIKILFEMTTSHSEFTNIMLNSSIIKRDLVELLWILINKKNSIMNTSHVPLYLSAYNATLNETDQFLLLILQYYETHTIKMTTYRPYLWGEAAAVHYSVKGEINTALWRQPSITQVLNLFDSEMINNTIKHYPVNRDLKATEIFNTGEKNVYDPAFFLPLLSFLLSENNVVRYHKVTTSGAMAIAFAACGSNCPDVRLAAYTVISRFYFHVDASSLKDKLLWMRLVDSLRSGIVTLNTPLENLQLSCLISTFLARTCIVATQPLHPLYTTIHSYLMAKQALDLKRIPEFLKLFNSSDVEHIIQRQWIIKIIRDGLKTDIDIDVALQCVIFKILLDFYTCVLSDAETKKLILEVIEVTSNNPRACCLLIRNYGFLPWLMNTANFIDIHDLSSVSIIINIVSNVLDNLPSEKDENINCRVLLLSTLMTFKAHLFNTTNLSYFINYISVLQKLISYKYVNGFWSKPQVKEFIKFASSVVEDVDECENMLDYGIDYVKLNDVPSKSTNELEVAQNKLRLLIWTWCNNIN